MVNNPPVNIEEACALEEKLLGTYPRSVGVQYATAEEWRNSSRKNEEAVPKRKRCPAMDVSGSESQI